MKLTREEMYQSALHDSPEMWKMKAIECLEYLSKMHNCVLDGSWLDLQSEFVFCEENLSESVRTAILEVCKP